MHEGIPVKADGVMLDEAQLMPLVEQLPAIW